MSRMHDRLWMLGNIAFVTALVVPITWISSAYAVQLNAIGIISPAGAFQNTHTANPQLGHVVESTTFGDFQSQFQQIQFSAPLVLNSQTFIVRWLNTVMKNKTNLLWSSYPASIRGQVFSNKPAGGDPFLSGGW